MEREITLHQRERRMASLLLEKWLDRSASACYNPDALRQAHD